MFKRPTFSSSSSALVFLLLISAPCVSFAQENPAPPPAVALPDADASPKVPTLTTPEVEKKADDTPVGDFLSGLMANSYGDMESAILYLERVHKTDPNNTAITNQLMVLKLSAGHVPQATAIAKELVKTDNHELIVDLLLMLEQVKAKNLPKAYEIIETATTSGKDSLWVPLLRAWLDAGQSNFKQPIEAVDLMTDTDKVPAFIYYQLAILNDYAGYTDAASRQYQLAVGDKSRAAYRAVEAAANFYARQGDQAALDTLQKNYSDMPDLVIPDIKSSKPAKMITTVEDGLGEVIFTMASLLYNLDAGRDTLLYTQLALYLKPDFPVVQLLLGSLLESFQNYPAATLAYDGINPKSRLYEKAMLRKAFVLDRENKQGLALKLLDRLAATSANNPEPLIAKGDILRSKSDFKNAAIAYDQAIQRVPVLKEEHWALLFARGACYERNGEWDKAERDLQKSLELSPEQPEALNYLGYSWLVRNTKLDQAQKMIEKAYALRPAEPHIIDSLAWVYFKNGRVDDAQTLLEKAIDLSPNDPAVNEHLGDIYWVKNRQTEARFQWERALENNPDQQTADLIKTKLQNGLSPADMPAPAAGSSEQTTPAPKAASVK